MVVQEELKVVRAHVSSTAEKFDWGAVDLSVDHLPAFLAMGEEQKGLIRRAQLEPYVDEMAKLGANKQLRPIDRFSHSSQHPTINEKLTIKVLLSFRKE